MKECSYVKQQLPIYPPPPTVKNFLHKKLKLREIIFPSIYFQFARNRLAFDRPSCLGEVVY